MAVDMKGLTTAANAAVAQVTSQASAVGQVAAGAKESFTKLSELKPKENPPPR